MKKILLASAAAASLFVSGSAIAADLPSRQMVAPVVVAPVSFSWTGAYAGVNAGYAWNSNNNKYNVWNGATYIQRKDNNNGGFTGGGQVGYNYQFGQFVAGLETDINYADLQGKNSNNTIVVNDPATHVFGATNNGIEWFGTVRARAGVAIDRAFVYGTGGFAYGAGNSYRTTLISSNGAFVSGKNSGNTQTGWTLGAGVEYAITNNITARLEGLYVNLGKGKTSNIYTSTANNVTTSISTISKRKDTEFGVVRAGLNYSFN